jgi:hypothetical protein
MHPLSKVGFQLPNRKQIRRLNVGYCASTSALMDNDTRMKLDQFVATQEEGTRGRRPACWTRETLALHGHSTRRLRKRFVAGLVTKRPASLVNGCLVDEVACSSGC